ncbi:MAG: hypothetical protein FWJ90_12610 [Actinomadura sp.]
MAAGGSGTAAAGRAAIPSPANLALSGAAVLLVIVAGVTDESFLTEGNMTDLLRQMVTTGLLSLGMLIVIVTGGIDLSARWWR